MKKLFAAAVAAAALTLCACGDITDAEKTTLHAGEAIRVGSFKGTPIFYQRVRDPYGSSDKGLYIVPGATTAYERSCGKNCTETITTGAGILRPDGRVIQEPPPVQTPRDAALAKLSAEERTALGL